MTEAIGGSCADCGEQYGNHLPFCESATMSCNHNFKITGPVIERLCLELQCEICKVDAYSIKLILTQWTNYFEGKLTHWQHEYVFGHIDTEYLNPEFAREIVTVYRLKRDIEEKQKALERMKEKQEERKKAYHQLRLAIDERIRKHAARGDGRMEYEICSEEFVASIEKDYKSFNVKYYQNALFFTW